MRRKLVVVLNREVPLAKSLNALAHIAVGMGHRIPKFKMPEVSIRFACSNYIYAIRKATQQYEIKMKKPNSIAYADFLHTIADGTAVEQAKQTIEIPERQLNYFAACVCADIVDIRTIFSLIPHQSTFFKNKDYSPFLNLQTAKENDSSFDFNEEVTINNDYKYTGPLKKISLILNDKMPLTHLINPLITTCLEVGKKTKLSDLHLLTFIDKDGGKHSNISYHSLPVLIPNSMVKYQNFVDDLSKYPDIISETGYSYDRKNLIATCLFSDKEKIEMLANRKNFSLWRKDLHQVDLDFVNDDHLTSEFQI